MIDTKLRIGNALATLLFLSSIWAIPVSATELQADLILRHGEIYVPDGWAQSLAIKDNVIIAVGDEEAVNRHKTEKTRIIDLNGAAVLPGLHDMHVHPMGAGLMERSCRFPQGSPPQVILDTIKRCADERPKGEWIRGGQWEAASFGGTPPHRAMLDRVAPDNPVALNDISMHSIWLNSKALELAGITAETSAPEGGVIERDENGEPTGVLRENARTMLQGVIPQPTKEERAGALKWALDTMLSYGITTLTDAGVHEDTLKIYAGMADNDELKQRIRVCQNWNRNMSSGMNRKVTEYHLRRNRYSRERLQPDCIKIVLDGVPTDGHTAAMVKPYADAGHMDDTRASGLLLVPAERLEKALIKFDAAGFNVKMHAAGDAAVRAGLDAIEATRKANGFSGVLHDVSHNSFVQMSDIRRARGIAATFEMSPYIWYPNPIIPDIAKAVGPERMLRWIPVKDAIDAGALVVPGSDWSVVPSVNPWLAMETLVTRQRPGGGGEVLGAQERITLQQAIDMFTVNSAVQMGHRDRVGSIERGMLADVIVLDRNPLKIPITEVHKTTVTTAIINGEIVYRQSPK